MRNWWFRPSLFQKVSLSPAWCDHLGIFQQACSHTSLTYDRQSRPSFKAAAGPNMAISFPSAAVYQCHSGSTMQNLSLCLPPSLTLLLSLASPSLHYCQGQEFLTPDSTPSSRVIYLFSRSHRSIRFFFSGAVSGYLNRSSSGESASWHLWELERVLWGNLKLGCATIWTASGE